MSGLLECSLAFQPEERTQIINISEKVKAEVGDALDAYPRTFYCSFHTTAGYADQPLMDRLRHDEANLRAYIGSFQHIFPQHGPYRHDQLHLRTELSEDQRTIEPRNADSHLTFISSGLENCVTYEHRPETPVYFVELDGINDNDDNNPRLRKTRVIGFNDSRRVHRERIPIEMASHQMDSVNLRDRRLGFIEQLDEIIQRLGLPVGRVEISLADDERNTGLTVNEYETLLMRHDLIDVLKNPLQFMAERGASMLRDPLAIPEKARNYAKYDLVHLVNRLVEKLGWSESVIERAIDKMLAMPASRLLRMKRSVNMLISEGGRVCPGTYQSPILVQWRRAPENVRYLDVQFFLFE